MLEKRLQYSYPSSPQSVEFGNPDAGHWYVTIGDEVIIAHPDFEVVFGQYQIQPQIPGRFCMTRAGTFPELFRRLTGRTWHGQTFRPVYQPIG